MKRQTPIRAFSQFLKSTTFLILFAACAPLLFSNVSYGGSWPECKHEKLLALKLNKALRKGKFPAGYKKKAAIRADLRAADRFVYKECKSHRKKLRELEKKSL